jgi:putative oxidoreductase
MPFPIVPSPVLNNLGLLIVRLVVGAIFVVHGLQKKGSWRMQPSEQNPQNLLLAFRILSIAEPLGGIAIALGFLTQWAAVGIAIIMVGAMVLKIGTWHKKFAEPGGWELDLLILAVAVMLIFRGAGSIALDRLWFGL